MPIKSDLSLTSVVYDAALLTLTWVCVAGSENQYDGMLMLDDGTGMAEPAGTYTAWTDTGGVLTLVTALTPGTYAAQLINGDGETSNTLAAVFKISSGSAGILYEKIYTF